MNLKFIYLLFVSILLHSVVSLWAVLATVRLALSEYVTSIHLVVVLRIGYLISEYLLRGSRSLKLLLQLDILLLNSVTYF